MDEFEYQGAQVSGLIDGGEIVACRVSRTAECHLKDS